MLFFGWGRVLKLLEGLLDITRHGEMNLALAVVPVQCYANVSVARPVSGDLVILLQRLLEVACMLLPNVFDPKIIHD